MRKEQKSRLRQISGDLSNALFQFPLCIIAWFKGLNPLIEGFASGVASNGAACSPQHQNLGQ